MLFLAFTCTFDAYVKLFEKKKFSFTEKLILGRKTKNINKKEENFKTTFLLFLINILLIAT
jgi:hypothetical protein